MLVAMRNYFNAFTGFVSVGLVALLSGCASQNLAFENIGDGLCSNEQSQLIEKHISDQINALSDQNWKKAYGFAAPSFQEVEHLSESSSMGARARSSKHSAIPIG